MREREREREREMYVQERVCMCVKGDLYDDTNMYQIYQVHRCTRLRVLYYNHTVHKIRIIDMMGSRHT